MDVKETRKLTGLVFIHLKKWCIYSSFNFASLLKGMQSSKLSMSKGYHLLTEGIRKLNLFCQKWFIKV